jgi:sulfotransferase family protein
VTLPTFVGIGVPRAGTTWLHALLAAHPDVYMPTQRKEIRFFDRYFDRGLPWYETFFETEGGRHAAVGEISPQYFYPRECPERIASTLPEAKLLVMLRHPVDRAYSNYGFVVQRKHYRGSFQEYLASRPRAVEMGHYGPPLVAYLRRFGRDRILPLVFERTVGDGTQARADLAAFLGIRADGFPESVGRVNATTIPRHPGAASFAVRVARTLRQRHLDGLVDVGERLGVRRLWANGERMPKLDRAVRAELSPVYEDDVRAVEDALQVDLSCWRS